MALQDAVGALGHRLAHKALVERVVDDLDFIFRDVEDAREVPLGRMGHGHDAVGPRQGAPREKQSPGLKRGRNAGRRSENVRQVVNRDHQPRRHDGRRIKPGHVQKIDAPLVQQEGQMQVRVEGARLGRIFEQGEIFGQGIEFLRRATVGRSVDIPCRRTVRANWLTMLRM